jgi:hypothetical protein
MEGRREGWEGGNEGVREGGKLPGPGGGGRARVSVGDRSVGDPS